jgi:mono/diheme cytochrome c family protein
MIRTAPFSATVLLVALACACCSRPADLPPDFDERVTGATARRDGLKLYLESCAICHGERGDGQGARVSAFATPPRDFTNETWRASTTPARVYRTIRDGVPGTAMPGWRALGDDALVNLTAYVLSVKPAKGPS